MTERDQEFEEYLQKIEDPKNQSQINRSLPRNPTSLQIAKYKLCKKILGYKLKNDKCKCTISIKLLYK